MISAYLRPPLILLRNLPELAPLQLMLSRSLLRPEALSIVGLRHKPFKLLLLALLPIKNQLNHHPNNKIRQLLVTAINSSVRRGEEK